MPLSSARSPLTTAGGTTPRSDPAGAVGTGLRERGERHTRRGVELSGIGSTLSRLNEVNSDPDQENAWTFS